MLHSTTTWIWHNNSLESQVITLERGDHYYLYPLEQTLESGYTLPELHTYPDAQSESRVQIQRPSTAHPAPGVTGLPLIPSTWSLHPLEKTPSGSNLAFMSKNLPSSGVLPLGFVEGVVAALAPVRQRAVLVQRHLLQLVDHVNVQAGRGSGRT
jgi:hypothetical protein